jgi:L-alanine-DL-glutamate epimerase-like enolase superfamily enzyme
MPNDQSGIKRRSMMGMVAGAAALETALAEQAPQVRQPGGVNQNSAPSQLRITDMRAIRIASNYDYPIIRIDTNQGVYGLGEARDAGNEGMALVLKPHIVGRNPLNIEPLLDSVRNFTNQRRFGGGYSALDIALHDIAGKVYGVPAWRLIGSQYRNRIRCYCDTTESSSPKIYAERMTARKKKGFTFFKMDIMPSMIRDRPGGLNTRGVATAKGLEMYGEHIPAVRDAIGWDQPLAADHFGPCDLKDAIRHARFFEKYELA